MFSVTYPASSERAAGARILDRAEGVLVALRRCRVEEAFNEIVMTSREHLVPALRVAQALVELAERREPADDQAGTVARQQWAHLLEAVRP